MTSVPPIAVTILKLAWVMVLTATPASSVMSARNVRARVTLDWFTLVVLEYSFDCPFALKMVRMQVWVLWGVSKILPWYGASAGMFPLALGISPPGQENIYRVTDELKFQAYEVDPPWLMVEGLKPHPVQVGGGGAGGGAGNTIVMPILLVSAAVKEENGTMLYPAGPPLTPVIL